MQRIGNLREKLLSFENLYSAFAKARRSTKNYASYRFAFNLERELLKLQRELAEGIYVPGDYHYFRIHNPKEREISVARFRDRVVHHALVKILEPIYERRFIHDSYATRKGKGTHRAIDRAQEYLRSNRWFLKMDVRKYFSSIDHKVLGNILAAKIKDPFVLELCRVIVKKGGDGSVGLPIGNLTSQFFANVYLDIFDHFIKDRLRVKYYLRYMDDLCLFSNEKEALKILAGEIESFLKSELKLVVKERATMINSRIHGLPFLGVRIYPNMIRHRRENFMRSYRKLTRRERQYMEGAIDYKMYSLSMQSLVSYLNYYGIGLLKSRLYRGAVSKAGPTA